MRSAASDAVVARALLNLVERELRKPIRTYRRHSWEAFSISGNVEAEDLLTHGEDGFRQTGLSFDRQNDFNRIIQDAMLILADQSRDSDLRRLLINRARYFGPQASDGKIPRLTALSSRNARWREALALSLIVHEDARLGSGAGFSVSPGFLIDTERAWEQFLFFAIRLGLPSAEVTKRDFELGNRTRFDLGANNDSQVSVVNVTPDISLSISKEHRVILDAKYKGRYGLRPTIPSADLYESLAFLKATGTKRVILLYPWTLQSSVEPGTAKVFETTKVDSVEVVGVSVAAAGLARSGGIIPFSKKLIRSLEPYLND